MKLPKEIQEQIKMVELNTKKLMNSLFLGEYHSRFKGQGMTFADFREYIPGDDVRSIAWPLTARTGKTYIKQYEEEREFTLYLAVDISASTTFGSGKFFKAQVEAIVAAIFGFSALKFNDPVGLFLFTDQVEHYVPPKKSPQHIHRIIRDLFFYEAKSPKTSLEEAFKYIFSIMKKHSALIVISDFKDDSNFEDSLKRISRKHEVIAITVDDPCERELPNMGYMDFLDAENGAIFSIDTGSSKVRREYQKSFLKGRENLVKKLQKSRAGFVEMYTDQDLIAPLLHYFQRRGR